MKFKEKAQKIYDFIEMSICYLETSATNESLILGKIKELAEAVNEEGLDNEQGTGK